MMDARHVVAAVDALAAVGIAVWLDGGLGVDALVGEQTRPHDDLDLVISVAEVDRTRQALARLGYATIVDELPTRCVVGAAGDLRIDLHTLTFDADGWGTQRLQDGSAWRCPPACFAGRGRVAGRPVRCLSAEAQLLAHLGYEPDAKDHHDMRLLRDRLGLGLPAPFDEA